jgi:subtilisin family serine protease
MNTPLAPLELVGLPALMQRTAGDARVRVAVIDGPVAIEDSALAGVRLSEIPGHRGACALAGSTACRHGTFVAGILSARRGSGAPAICPDCTLLVRPIFAEADAGMPSATADELAEAILDCLDAGARVLNVSASLARASLRSERMLEEALDECARRGAIVVVAAGNQGSLGSTAITRHPWVVPVVACDLRGRPLTQTNLGRSIGRMGIAAPGRGVTSLGPGTIEGTSVAAPFVTGTVALLWSLFPGVAGAEMRLAVTRPLARHT